MLKKAFFLFILLILIVSLFTFGACGGDDDEDSAESISPIKLVPQKADTLGYVNLSGILGDDAILALYQSIPSESLEALQVMDEIIATASKGLQQGVFFANTSSLSQIEDISQAAEGNDYSAIIIKGNFQQDSLISAIESASGETLTATTHGQHQIHSAPSGATVIAFVGQDGMIIGTLQAVKDVIDVMEGTRPALKGEILDSYNDLNGDLLKLVVILPQDTADAMAGESDFEMPLEIPLIGDFLDPSVLKDLQTVSLSLDKKGQSLPLALSLYFTSADSAESVKGLIDIMTEFIGSAVNMGMVPQEYAGFTDLLENLEAGVKASCLDIKIDLPVSSLRDLVDMSGSLSLPL